MAPLFWCSLLLGFVGGAAAAATVAGPGALAAWLVPVAQLGLAAVAGLLLMRVARRRLPALRDRFAAARAAAPETTVEAPEELERTPVLPVRPTARRRPIAARLWSRPTGPAVEGAPFVPAASMMAPAGVAPAAIIPAAVDPAALAQAAEDDIESALDGGRIEVHVQAIVSLPQRRVAFHEAFTRLRTADGRLLLPASYLGPAAAAGLIGRIDAVLLHRCALTIERGGEAMRVFVNVARESLADAGFVGEVEALLDARPELASSLILELDDLALDRAAADGLERLRRRGIGLSLDRLPGNGDPQELARRGFSFLKLRAERFAEGDQTRLDADLLALHRALNAAGITAIVDRIETERALAGVLDYPVAYGQGHLFGQPTPLAA